MKKKYLLILSVILLSAIAAFYFLTDSGGTIPQKYRKFAIADTSLISEIRISYKKEKISLSRKNIWTLNDNRAADWKLIRELQIILKNLQITSPIPSQQRSDVSDELEENGVLVEILSENETLRAFYINKANNDSAKTIVKMESGNYPFYASVPGYTENLSAFFSTDTEDWKDKTILSLTPDKIKQLKVECASKPEKNFTITITGKKIEVSHNNTIQTTKDSTILRYISYFEFIDYEKIAKKLTSAQKDSILKTPPEYKLSVTNNENQTTTIDTYPIRVFNQKDEIGNNILYDLNRLYIRVNNSKQILLAKYYVFDPLFVSVFNRK